MIREITAEELPNLLEMAHLFFNEGALPGRFSDAAFLKAWTGLITQRIGYVLVAEQGGQFTGALGAIAYPSLNTGEVEAMEAFWFVHPNFRGGLTALRLLNAFEGTARARGVARVTMVHLKNLMPDRLRHLYKRRGYVEIETHYTKGL
jgi:GNAT superfamily N-acetyltransferase